MSKEREASKRIWETQTDKKSWVTLLIGNVRRWVVTAKATGELNFLLVTSMLYSDRPESEEFIFWTPKRFSYERAKFKMAISYESQLFTLCSNICKLNQIIGVGSPWFSLNTFPFEFPWKLIDAPIIFFDLEAQSDIGWPTTLKIEQICCLELKGAGKL